MKKVGLGLLALLLLVYGGGVFYFSQATFPNTTVNGEDRSFENIGNVFHYRGTVETVQIKGREDKTAELHPKDIELKKQIKDAPQFLQNALAWPAAFFQQHAYNVEYNSTYNEDQLKKLLSESDLMRFQTEPEDAKLVKSEKDVAIEPEKEGTAITIENLVKAVHEGFDRDEDVITLPDEAYTQPKVRADDDSLKKELESAKEIYATKITYDFADRTYEFTGEKLMNLYDETDTGLEINYDRARELIADMARETDTFGASRQFVNAYGNEITLNGGGIYGWLIDVDATTDEFVEWVEQRHSEDTTPFYTVKGFRRETNDIGNTYIEIDIDSQWMWVFVDGEVINQGPTVTGQPNLNAETPRNVNTLRMKERDRYLKGISPETGREYDSLVNFWFPINWSDVGIHNSTWRTEFGGDIYLYNGSYACINVPDHLAVTIYEHVPIGAPVISY